MLLSLFLLLVTHVLNWLNQIEIWFSIFSRKALRGASFASPHELRQRIEDFIECYNPESKPFKWRKRDVRGAQIKDNIDNIDNLII